MAELTLPALGLSIGVAMQPIPGECVCGDIAVIAPRRDGMLVAAVDGVGHGDDAAEAARIASGILEHHAAEPIDALIHRCHERLRASRGVAMAVAAIDVRRRRLSWLGVGNTQGVLIHAAGGARGREQLMQRAGLVGCQLPALRIEHLPVGDGDLLALATDGVEDLTTFVPAAPGPPQQLADSTLLRRRRLTDDALILIASFGPEGPS